MKTINCPNCGTPNLVPEPSIKSGGWDNIICSGCNGVFQVSPFGVTLFPNATDQYGQPRQLRC